VFVDSTCHRVLPIEDGMADSDADLIQRWRAGDESAFEAVVRRWEPALARFLSRLAPPEQVPDLLQEVFLRVYRAGPAYRENGHFSTWLFRIALNAARDAGRRSRPVQPLKTEEPAASGEAASLECERRELAELLAQAVAELPAEQREVLALRHDRGMSFEDMGRILGVPASTLKSRFSSALTRLRRRLSELGYPTGGEP
jgi:RNA polymerase sigma-70 factor (ECF subfamily)